MVQNISTLSFNRLINLRKNIFEINFKKYTNIYPDLIYLIFKTILFFFFFTCFNFLFAKISFLCWFNRFYCCQQIDVKWKITNIKWVFLLLFFSFFKIVRLLSSILLSIGTDIFNGLPSTSSFWIAVLSAVQIFAKDNIKNSKKCYWAFQGFQSASKLLMRVGNTDIKTASIQTSVTSLIFCNKGESPFYYELPNSVYS